MKVAAIQMVSGTCLDTNLEHATNCVAQAAEQGAQFVVLPENFYLMPVNEPDKFACIETYGEGPLQAFLSQLAQKYHLYLHGGTIPIKSMQQGKIYSRSIVYDPHGIALDYCDKMHLFDVRIDENEAYVESDTLVPGERLVCVDTPLAKVGLTICYDLRFPEVYRKLGEMGAQFIVVPSAFTETTGRAHWEVLLRARAIENLLYIVAPNQGGRHENGRATFGHTMIISPWGEIMTQLDTGEGVAVADLDFEAMEKRREIFPVLRHRKVS